AAAEQGRDGQPQFALLADDDVFNVRNDSLCDDLWVFHEGATPAGVGTAATRRNRCHGAPLLVPRIIATSTCGPVKPLAVRRLRSLRHIFHPVHRSLSLFTER